MDFESEISLSPNPAKKSLEVSCSEIINTIEIIDITGKMVKKFQDVCQKKAEISVASMVKGIYVLKVTDINGRENYSKFIKE